MTITFPSNMKQQKIAFAELQEVSKIFAPC